MSALPPRATIGILGGGQLGRMLAMAAASLGYRTHIFAPDPDPVAADVSAALTRADYTNRRALARFARSVDVVTFEFENVPAEAVLFLAARVPVRPGVRALEVAQDRLVEKRFVEGLGGTPAPYAPVETLEDLETALETLGTPAILKTRRLGYDGKGQVRIDNRAAAREAFAVLGGQGLLLEAFVPFRSEFSILLARGLDGSEALYPPIANRHEGGILALSLAPAPGLEPAHVAAATALAVRIADALAYVGVLACEFFALADGPRFNEMAPRVHNSGHWTIEGAETSQFAQHIRAVAGLPLGSPALTGARARMRNILGAEVHRAHALLADPTARLHLYGKAEAAPGRKMGHVTHVDHFPVGADLLD
ncbi:5-(carboxyamino)imidazole ribonucleotide synthase [Thermaurantiacus sp.]